MLTAFQQTQLYMVKVRGMIVKTYFVGSECHGYTSFISADNAAYPTLLCLYKWIYLHIYLKHCGKSRNRFICTRLCFLESSAEYVTLHLHSWKGFIRNLKYQA